MTFVDPDGVEIDRAMLRDDQSKEMDDATDDATNGDVDA